jgi:hypothetical protein
LTYLLLTKVDVVSDTMDESGGTPDDDSTDVSRQSGPPVINIVADGDVILDVTFNNSRETLRQARKAAQSFSARKPATGSVGTLNPQVRVAYRVRLGALTQHSVYFENLLADTRFVEGRAIIEALEKLSVHGIEAKDAKPSDLPWVKIVDDDEATRSAGREVVFEDLLRILHGVENTIKGPAGMQYVAVMTVLADRFVCLPAVSRHLFSKGQFKWPAEKVRPLAREDDRVLAHEENLRQKVLVAWLLNRPPNFHAATRDLILKGSGRWNPYHEPETSRERAAWWDLQDGIESKSCSCN